MYTSRNSHESIYSSPNKQEKLVGEFFDGLKNTIMGFEKRRDDLYYNQKNNNGSGSLKHIEYTTLSVDQILSLGSDEYLKHIREKHARYLEQIEAENKRYLEYMDVENKKTSKRMSDSIENSKIGLDLNTIQCGIKVMLMSGKDISNELKIIDRFKPIFHNIGSKIDEVKLDYSTDDYLDFAEKYGVDRVELLENIRIRLIRILINVYEKYKKTGVLNLDLIDLNGIFVAQICESIKNKDSGIDIIRDTFFKYIDGPNFPEDKDNPQNEAIFERMADLYRKNYEGLDDFLNELIPRIKDKANGKCNFKTLYWDRNGDKNFEKDAQNLIGFLYFSEYQSKNGKKTKYLGGVNLDPNFQKSGLGVFIKRAIKEEFESGTEEIYLVVISGTSSEKMWQSFGFKYESYGDTIQKKSGGYIHLPEYKLTKERFNQLYSEVR